MLRRLLAAAALLLLVLLPAPLPARAQAAQDADPAIWVVRDADTTIYLFGTFHLLDSRPWFDDAVKAAFDASDELVLEARMPEDPAAMQALVARFGIDRQGPPLSSRLAPEQKAALERAVATLGIPMAGVDRFRPWFAATLLSSVAGRKLAIDAANGPETVLAAAARARGMKIDELEGFEWQFGMFAAIPEAQQMAMLRQGLDNLETLPGKLESLLASWSAGDVEALRRMVDSSGEKDAELSRILFADRNATWAGWIAERLKRPGTSFVAVGAGHLAGDASVQSLLAKRGIAAERIAY